MTKDLSPDTAPTAAGWAAYRDRGFGTATTSRTSCPSGVEHADEPLDREAVEPPPVEVRQVTLRHADQERTSR